MAALELDRLDAEQPRDIRRDQSGRTARSSRQRIEVRSTGGIASSGHGSDRGAADWGADARPPRPAEGPGPAQLRAGEEDGGMEDRPRPQRRAGRGRRDE